MVVTFPGDLTIDMPTSGEFEHRRLVYNDYLYFLLGLRERFAERLADYELLSGLPEADAKRISQNLMAGLSGRVPKPD